MHCILGLQTMRMEVLSYLIGGTSQGKGEEEHDLALENPKYKLSIWCENVGSPGSRNDPKSIDLPPILWNIMTGDIITDFKSTVNGRESSM